MKAFKYIYILIFLCISVLGNANGKAVPLFRVFSTQSTFTKALTANVTPGSKYSKKQSYLKFQKKINFKAFYTKGMKRKALQLESNVLPEFYKSDFVTIKVFKELRIYGLAIVYYIARHTYLHLYQLF